MNCAKCIHLVPSIEYERDSEGNYWPETEVWECELRKRGEECVGIIIPTSTK